MRVLLHDPIDGCLHIARAYMTLGTTGPLLVVGGKILDPANPSAREARIIKQPRDPDQVLLLKKWKALARNEADKRSPAKARVQKVQLRSKFLRRDR